jgi:uncharacterized repeat protein (TIGR03803 family)
LLLCTASACSAGGGISPLARVRDAPALQSPANGYGLLYGFGAKVNDGYASFSDLLAAGGTLYGTTEFGGKTTVQCYIGCGTIFSVTASGAERVTYRFAGGGDGYAPVAGLVALGSKLYGTTSLGGSGCPGGCGTVFVLGPGGKPESLLYLFRGGKDGAHPAAGLVVLDGKLYGTTQYGGKRTRLCFDGCGTVFALSAKGVEKVVYRFKGGTDGALPAARLTAIRGTLYGTTEYGGRTTALCSTGCGTVFALSPSGKKKTLYAFADTVPSADGAYPAAGVVAMGGRLYGTTIAGGAIGDGAVYSVDESSGAERVLHSFSCCASSSDGQYPYSRLTILDGALYGTTRNGGASNAGTIFTLSTSGAERVLHSFGGKPDAAIPQSGLTSLNGVLYGATTAGGANSEGAIFKLAP